MLSGLGRRTLRVVYGKSSALDVNSPSADGGAYQQVIQYARQRSQCLPEMNQDGVDDRPQDPNFLARKTTQVHQQPGLLGQLLRGGASGARSRSRNARGRVVAWAAC